VKAPAAKFGRSNRLGRASRSRAEGVPGASYMVSWREELAIDGYAATREDAMAAFKRAWDT
jgi:hypothetical protein